MFLPTPQSPNQQLIFPYCSPLSYRDCRFIEQLGQLFHQLVFLFQSLDNGNKEDVNPRIRKVFDYIEKNALAGKMNVIKFVSQFVSDSQQEVPCADENAEFSVIKKQLEEKKEQKAFFELLAMTADFDDVVRYCLKIKDFVRKRRLTEEQILMLKPYDDIREIMEKTKQTEE